MIQSSELIENFYHHFKDEYPGISLEEMKLICTAEFEMMKEVMQSDELEEIRLQYLFVVKVSQSRVLKHLKDIYSKREKGRISKKNFDKYNTLLLKHIENNPAKFKKYESRIREIIS